MSRHVQPTPPDLFPQAFSNIALKEARRRSQQNKLRYIPLFPPDLKVVGFAMYYFTYDPWVGKQLYLEDFYVMEPYRGTGVVPFTSFSVDFLLSLAPHLFCPSRVGHRLGGPATSERRECVN